MLFLVLVLFLPGCIVIESETETIQTEEAEEQVKTKQDKCSYLDEKRETLTVEEYKEQLGVCYNKEYITYALTADNPEICKEIVKPSYYSPCIASIAFKRNNIGLCRNLRYEEWETEEYPKKLNTKELCYYYFVNYNYLSNISEAEIENWCNNILNTKLKTQCLERE